MLLHCHRCLEKVANTLHITLGECSNIPGIAVLGAGTWKNEKKTLQIANGSGSHLKSVLSSLNPGITRFNERTGQARKNNKHLRDFRHDTWGINVSLPENPAEQMFGNTRRDSQYETVKVDRQTSPCHSPAGTSTVWILPSSFLASPILFVAVTTIW